MPEVLATIPALNLPTGNSSETETTTNTDRSSPDNMTRTHNAATKRPLQQNGGPNKKSRKSNGRRGISQKKPPLKVNHHSSLQKNIAALQLKSQIPRALHLTPSSSSISLQTNAPSSLVPIPTPAISTTPRLGSILQRQNSAFLNYRVRKSVSQMEFRNSHRHGYYQVPKSPGRHTNQDNKALVPNPNAMVTSSQTMLVKKIIHKDDYYYMVQERDPKLAGMRIFATIMLNAWRKRRDEVKRLMDAVNDLKRGSTKAKNQLHVFNTLFRVEQKRNDELSCQLKRSLEDVNDTKSSCESLATSLISLKTDKDALDQQLHIKEQECDGLNSILMQTKSDLFKAMSMQRVLQANLSCEQRKVQSLENHKNELINEICELNNDSLQKEEKLRIELLVKDTDLEKAKADIKLLENLLNDMKGKEFELRDHIAAESRLKNEIETLRSEVHTLRQCLAATVGHRLKTCWDNSMAYKNATCQLMHWVAFCMLPATPPPKVTSFPFRLSLEKVLSIVNKR